MKVNREQKVSFVSSTSELTSSRCFTGSCCRLLRYFRCFISALVRLVVESRVRRVVVKNVFQESYISSALNFHVVPVTFQFTTDLAR